jgi:hypothetical protein
VSDSHSSGEFRRPSKKLDRVLEGIVKYMVGHPDAKDTVQGIATWWQPGSELWTVAELDEALTILGARDWVVTRDLGRGARLYGANVRRLGEMRQYLADIEGSSQIGREESL